MDVDGFPLFKGHHHFGVAQNRMPRPLLNRSGLGRDRVDFPDLARTAHFSFVVDQLAKFAK